MKFRIPQLIEFNGRKFQIGKVYKGAGMYAENMPDATTWRIKKSFWNPRIITDDSIYCEVVSNKGNRWEKGNVVYVFKDHISSDEV